MQVLSSKCRADAVRNLAPPGTFARLISVACGLGVAAVCTTSPWTAVGQLQVLQQANPQCVFAGEGRRVLVTVHNLDTNTLEADLEMRLYQASSATAVLINQAPWKRLQVLGGQTVMESAVLALPKVTAGTRFLVQWVSATNHLIGKTELLVYPQGLLKDLKPLVESEPLGAFDPQNQLRPPLKDAGVEILDLEDTGLENFSGKLAIIGPFQARNQMPRTLPRQIQKLAEKGVAVVWLQPPLSQPQAAAPSFFTVQQGNGAVVVVDATLVSNLPDNPIAQLNLIRFAELALHPEPSRLPFLSSEP